MAFWVAIPPILIALSVAFEANFVAELENNDQPWKDKWNINNMKIKFLAIQGNLSCDFSIFGKSKRLTRKVEKSSSELG